MRITKLDGLRGIFSLMIVPLHYSKEYLPDFIYNNFVVREAYTFVDFFFVLSGFVIAYNYNDMRTFTEFYIYMKKRIARLYPLLFFTSTLYLFYRFLRNFSGTIVPSLAEGEGIQSTKTIFLNYFESILFTNSNYLLGNNLGINGPSWSISAEIIAYIVFGLITVYAVGSKKKIALFMVILASVLFCIYKGELFMTSTYGFVRGLISFNLGYFVYLFSLKKIKLHNKLEYIIPILLLIIFYFLNTISDVGVAKQMLGLITIPTFFALSILLLLKTNGRLSKFLDTKPMQFLGKTSYSIYLNHQLLVIIVPIVFFKIFGLPENDFMHSLVFALAIFLVVFYSKYTYKFIEVQGGKFLRKILFRSS
ncbi:acyltransferase family protein [Aureibaculum conchae]|uniref:acyltransferase family protein n=1 Tax=Aureibaculum sp. 2308TA14-22 TaxID=3108392 RepID=UPI003391B03C